MVTRPKFQDCLSFPTTPCPSFLLRKGWGPITLHEAGE